MKGKKWLGIFVLIMGLSGCGVLSDDFFEESNEYGQRNAENFAVYLQGMESAINEEKQEILSKEFAELPVWESEEWNSTVQKTWIQFEEELRTQSVPIGYADLESFLETEKKDLGDKGYQQAMDLVMKWKALPEDDEANLTIEAEMDQILENLELSFVDLVSMVNDHEAVLGVYRVQNNELIASDPQWLTPMKKSSHQEELVLQIWKRVQALIPADLLSRVVEFAAVTDGEDNTMAYVYPVEALHAWRLTIDYLDFLDAEGQLSSDLADETLLHEFGHILSLNETQMDAEAVGTLQLEEGNLARGSYLNRFYQRFWREYETEREEMQADGDSEEANFNFYLAHKGEFLNDYAATSPAEDFAETFAQFVLREQPYSTPSRVEEKLIFFYQFPELMKMRTQIRKECCLLEEAA